MVIGAALVGGSFSVRQILLHIAPVEGEPTGYGSAVLGMHLYTWAAIVFLTTIAGTAVFLCLIRDEPARTVRRPTLFDRGTLLFATLLCLSNALATFVECGAGVISVEHGTTEYWGMENCARYVQETWPDLNVHYLSLYPKSWTVA